MATPTTAKEALDNAVLGPKKVKVGNEEVEQHSLGDLQSIADREAGNTAGNRNHMGLRFVGLVPPGTG